MSTLWLPPLNSHAEYITAVRIEEEEEKRKSLIFCDWINWVQQWIPEREEVDTDTLYLCVQFKCTVLFFPANYKNFELFVNSVNEIGFPALRLDKWFVTEERFNGRDIHHESVKYSIKRILEYCNISWKLYPIRVLEENEDYNYILEDEFGLTQKIQSVLVAKATHWMEMGIGILPLCLHIFKHVSIPVDEHSAWVEWFLEKKKFDPNFEKEYEKEIKRYRTMDEIFYEDDMNKFKSASKSFIQELEDTQNFDLHCGKDCTICLGNLDCVQLTTKLPCSHVFHKTCIIKWLTQSHMCPVCRTA